MKPIYKMDITQTTLRERLFLKGEGDEGISYSGQKNLYVKKDMRTVTF